MLVSLKLIDSLFLKLPEEKTVQHLPCWERWNVPLFADILTRQGFEVESTVLRGNDLRQVVVGRIRSAEKHPKADKLQVCQVETAAGDTRQIVCGAANARAGLFVAVALPGASLPGGLQIKSSKIRDVESHGMLCSREELGLPVDEERDGSGIWELHSEPACGRPEAELTSLMGQPVMFALGLDDVLFELNVTPNRPDMLCHEGVARELEAGFTWRATAGFTRKNWNEEWQGSLSAKSLAQDAETSKAIKLNAGTFSARNELGVPAFFVGLENVRVTHTPGWMRNALEALGQKSINSVVDAGNFILLCFAQPNHAFDVCKLAADDSGRRQLSLRFARMGESFLGLDAKERSLADSDCVVADNKSSQALLGVIGGENSKVDASSASLVLEFANPHPVLVRRTSRRHGRKTDSSFAFEKGIDVFRRFEAAQKLVGLMNFLQKKSGAPVQYVGTVYPESAAHRNAEAQAFFPTDAHGHEPQLKRPESEFSIRFQRNDVLLRVGEELVDFEKQLAILRSLGFVATKTSSPDVFDVVVPTWRRLDVAGAADLVEEIVRVVGIDHVPAHPLTAAGKLLADDPHLALFESLAQRMVALGYHETSGFHFMRADDWSRLRMQSVNACGEPIALLNPIIKDEPLMQTTLLSGLLRKVAHNLNYGVKRGQLFEISRTFQNMSKNAKRVFERNGEGVELSAELAAHGNHKFFEYAPTEALLLSREETAQDRPGETPRVCGIVFGSEEEKNWLNSGDRAWSFHKVAAQVSEVMRVFACEPQFVALPTEHPFTATLHPGRSAAIAVTFAGETIPVGWVGQLHPGTLRQFEIESDCYAFEINLATAFALHNRRQLASQSSRTSVAPGAAVVRLPSVERDFAFLLDESVLAGTLVDTVRTAIERDALQKLAIPAKIVGIRIFDVYRGQGVAQGKKSVALRVTLLPLERTLVDADIVAVSDAAIAQVTEHCGAQLRG